MSIPLQLILSAVVTWVVWRISRFYLTSSPLDNIQGPARTSFLTGNLGEMYDRHGWAFHDEMSEKYGWVAKFHSLFGGKRLYVSDPKALTCMLLKEQHVYEESPWVISWNLFIHGPCLAGTLGDHHRITPIFYQTVHRLRSALLEQVNSSPTEVDLLQWFNRTALELLGQGGLGYSFDPLAEPMQNDLGEAIKKLTMSFSALPYVPLLAPYFKFFGSPQFRRKLVEQWLPTQDMKHLRDGINTMHREATGIFNKKKSEMQTRDEDGKDLMNVLLKANIKAAGQDKLPDSELLAQMGVMIFAATDTTSSALSRSFEQLCIKPDIQKRLRAEIIQAVQTAGGDLSYERLMELPYLDAFCREILRLFPPVPYWERQALQDAVLPLLEPVRGVDGKLIYEIPVPKGTIINIGIRACNRNKAIWGDDALEFKPERWLSSLPDAVNKAHIPGVYSNLLTFLGGERSCIGYRFALLEMKVVLSVLLQTFKFSQSNKDIYWNMALIEYPTVGPISSQPTLPIMVERIDAE